MDLADRVMDASLEGERVRAEVVEGGEHLEVDGLLVALSNLPAPELNGARVIREPDDPPGALAAAEQGRFGRTIHRLSGLRAAEQQRRIGRLRFRGEKALGA